MYYHEQIYAVTEEIVDIITNMCLFDINYLCHRLEQVMF